jgi:hypothetical protein
MDVRHRYVLDIGDDQFEVEPVPRVVQVELSESAGVGIHRNSFLVTAQGRDEVLRAIGLRDRCPGGNNTC